MTSVEGGWQDLAVAVELARKDPVCLGIAPGSGGSHWVVWISTFGDEFELLSGWWTREKATAALLRCVGACADGSSRFLAQVARERSVDGFVAPGVLSPEVLAETRGIANLRIYCPQWERLLT